jgi:hypothetical protein
MPNLRTLASIALVSSCSLAFGAACSSKGADTGPGVVPPPEDTGTVDDTTPPEDTAPPPWATNPDGPYGLLKGNVFPNLSFDGYKGGAGGEWTTIKMIDYYDPDGTRGIYGILFVVSAEWCNPCRIEAAALPGMYTNLYKPRGAAFAGALLQDSKSNPADQPTLDRWIKAFKTNFDLVIDPDQTSVPPSWSIPRNYLINPRDMKIYRINSGTSSDPTTVPGLTPLLNANGAPPLPDAGVPDTGPVDTGAADTGAATDTATD